MNRFLLLISFISLTVGCDKKDACLDSGGCWDKVADVCRKDEPNAKKLCDRISTNFSINPYLEDFEALKTHISKSYANLEYLIDYYKIDPYQLNKQTIANIKAAANDTEALDALKAFVNTFKDGHFQLRKLEKDELKKEDKAKAPIAKSASAKKACEALNYSWEKDFNFKFPVEGVIVEEEGQGEFPYLVIKKGPKKVGIIRVADFRETVYPKTCMEAWTKYQTKIIDHCDEGCQEQFKYSFMRDALVDNFYKSLDKVRSKDVNALIIDLTNNGGGTDWVEVITALLTTKALKCGKSGFVKHPHHAKNFKKLLEDIKRNSPNDKAKISAMEKNLKIASKSCDRTSIWTEKGYKLSCTSVGYRQVENCKYGELKHPGKTKYNGKLFFLVNGSTASAAEGIVARHLDSKTATVIGSRTRGSGCGSTNGGIKFQLPNSGLNVKVPDCVRVRADGTNEVVGIEPDLKLDMSKLKDFEFLANLLESIEI